jgi:hypothetical protein
MLIVIYKMEHACDRCGYITNRISNLRTHLQKKTPCENIFDCDKTGEQLLNDIDKDKAEFNYTCDKCNAQFRSRQGKWKHMKTCNAHSVEDTNVPAMSTLDTSMLTPDNAESVDNLKRIISRQGEEIKKLKEHIRLQTSTTQNITNQNITNNITIMF